jgi:hypothetical protein
VLAAERSAGLHAMPGERWTKLLKKAADPVLVDDVPGKGVCRHAGAASAVARDAALQVASRNLACMRWKTYAPCPTAAICWRWAKAVSCWRARVAERRLRFPVPATDLVVAHNGRRALALARREKAVRVSRIDLVSGKVEDWFSAELHFWAGEYDGATWSVVADERLMVLDATAEGQVRCCGKSPTCLARSSVSCSRESIRHW